MYRAFFRNTLFLIIASVTLLPSSLFAQAQRAEDAIYLRPRVGISFYLGDNEKSPFNFDGEMFDNDFPYSLGAELGYQFNPRYSLGLAFTAANYPGVTEFVDGLDVSEHPVSRTSIQLIARYLLSEGKLAPYLQAGFHATFGKTALFSQDVCLTTGPCAESSETSFGPLVGVGLDYAISENTSLFVEMGANLTAGDDKADGYDDNGFGPFDFLGATSFGLKLNLTRFTPVEVGNLMCPADQVETGMPVTFSGTVNDNATQPVNATWDFGDGNTAVGLTATHSFTRAGSYNVMLTATNGNGKGTSSRTCPVNVVPACETAAIVSMRASNMSPDTQTAVSFSANVSGTAPVTYRWDFGDGNVSTSANPSHTYSTAGTYTVTLVATNCGGTVRRTMTITVNPYEAAMCREITEMSPAYFGRNSSTLSDEARQALGDNLEILSQCPNLNVRVEGLAAPGERMAQELSEDRARAVEQFYLDNGIAASRIVSVGLGRATGLTSKKEGLSAYRRVDTIPVR